MFKENKKMFELWLVWLLIWKKERKKLTQQQKYNIKKNNFLSGAKYSDVLIWGKKWGLHRNKN